MRKFLSALLFLIISINVYASNDLVIVEGYVFDHATGETLSNCHVVVNYSGYGTTTNKSGYYSLKLPSGEIKLTYSYIGFLSQEKHLKLNKDSKSLRQDIYLVPNALTSETVTYKQKPLDETLVQKIETVDIRRIPSPYSDVMRAVKILPGVSSNNELSSSFNVRGGNFDENLIYLNGYEIYRPYMLRQGIEENLSLANQEMVENIEFHNGAFPAMFGDKMSSALKINYKKNFEEGVGGEAKANLIYTGVELHQRSGKLSWIGGARYANPSLFVNQQHTEGEYTPEFYDGQVLMNYSFTSQSELELFVLSLKNTYRLQPKEWVGHHGAYYDPQQVSIEYDGARSYSTRNQLVGLKYQYRFKDVGLFDLSYANYEMTETEEIDVNSEYYDDGSAWFPGEQREFIKQRHEYANNHLRVNTNELKSNQMLILGNNTFRTGFRTRVVDLEDKIKEEFVESGSDTDLLEPHILTSKHTTAFNSFSAYLMDEINFKNILSTTIGVRYLYYELTDEALVSPRISLNFRPNVLNTFNFSYGHYYQPPFYYEIRNKPEEIIANLESQKSIHYVFGWEHRLNHQLVVTTEVYYKELDNLIPYYVERVKLEYGDSNNSEGFAKGVDILLKGEIIERLNSWLGYSYLDTQERVKGSDNYKRRVLDQTHTLRFFLQDNMPDLSHIQSHLRILFGSGYRYYTRQLETDDESRARTIVVDQSYTKKYPFYMRFDAGFTFNIKMQNGIKLVALGEVQNMFYHTNVADYTWVQIYADNNFPTRIVNLYPGRFFNIGLEILF